VLWGERPDRSTADYDNEKQGMLIIKRKAQDVITIAPAEGMDLNRPISDLFEGGIIEIKMLEVGRRQVKVAIDATNNLQIWRGYRDARSEDESPAIDPAVPAADTP